METANLQARNVQLMFGFYHRCLVSLFRVWTCERVGQYIGARIKLLGIWLWRYFVSILLLCYCCVRRRRSRNRRSRSPSFWIFSVLLPYSQGRGKGDGEGERMGEEKASPPSDFFFTIWTLVVKCSIAVFSLCVLAPDPLDLRNG